MQDLRDPAVFRATYIRHHARVRRAAMRVLLDADLADDVTQEVFLRLWRAPERFDPTRGELVTYLCLQAHSRALDRWRSEQVRARAADRLDVATAHEPRSSSDP